jgi:hypothetical protein
MGRITTSALENEKNHLKTTMALLINTFHTTQEIRNQKQIIKRNQSTLMMSLSF